jgi:hypothetical protein
MPLILVVGLVLDVAALVGRSAVAAGAWPGGDVLITWVLAGASTVSLVGVVRAKGLRRRRGAIVAFVIGAAGIMAAALAMLGTLSSIAFAIGLVAQAMGWSFLATVERADRRPLVAIATVILALVLHLVIPLATKAESFGISIADAVLTSDIETPEDELRHRAAVDALAHELATKSTAATALTGIVCLGLLVALWQRPTT